MEPARSTPSIATPLFATPELVSFLDGEPGCELVLLNVERKPMWCNRTRELEAGVPDRAEAFDCLTDEHAPLLDRARLTAKGVSYFEFRRGRRWFVRLWPLDPARYEQGGWLWCARPASLTLRESVPVLTVRRGDFGDLAILSRRELEVMRLVAEGLPTKQVARTLHRAPKTVANQLTSLHRKLQLSSRGALTRLAVERGITAFSRDDWMRLTAQAHDVHAGSSSEPSRQTP